MGMHADEGALAHASTLQLALTGMLFGLVHVLTGPDHLSALATLSAGSSWRSFSLGIRWGCGHSIGLILMAIVFIALDGKLDFTVLNTVTDVLVGVFMVALGLYGVAEGIRKSRATRRRQKQQQKNGALPLAQDSGDEEEDSDEERHPDSTDDTDGTATDMENVVISINGDSLDSPTRQRHPLGKLRAKPVLEEEQETHGNQDESEDRFLNDAAADAESEILHKMQHEKHAAVPEVSPTESTVDLQELLSRGDSKSDGGENSHKRKCKCPRVDFKNAQTQKVRPLFILYSLLVVKTHAALAFCLLSVHSADRGHCPWHCRPWWHPGRAAGRRIARHRQVCHVPRLVLRHIHRHYGRLCGLLWRSHRPSG